MGTNVTQTLGAKNKTYLIHQAIKFLIKLLLPDLGEQKIILE